jgi:hypothetical protein
MTYSVSVWINILQSHQVVALLDVQRVKIVPPPLLVKIVSPHQ